VLKRVLDLRCYEPVPVGCVVELRGCEVLRARAHMVVALCGTPLLSHSTPWMDGLMQFVHVDGTWRPEPLEGEPSDALEALPLPWADLRERARRLLTVRS
jgi:acyl-CoA thioesterase YciA